MKKIIMLAAIAALGISANATANPPQGGPKGEGHFGGFMQNLTEEQKACIEAANCPKTEKRGPKDDSAAGDHKVKERGAKSERPERPEMSEEDKAAMQASRECMKKAFENCGIEMPERPEGGKKPKPQQ